ncbi:ABC transporter permease subunit [Vibrio alfacsensis]|uniref:ABC transporter permease subunit n=1 Tax=Vibrio alfacsensis TaxID=1074311 RepID=UPI0040681D72
MNTATLPSYTSRQCTYLVRSSTGIYSFRWNILSNGKHHQPKLSLRTRNYLEAIQLLLSVWGFGPFEISGFWAGVLVIAIVQGAYATEVIRGAINSVPKGQIEAAYSFGLRPFAVFYRITIPEMLPTAMPGLSNLWLIAMKDTALLAVVGFTELTLAAKQAAGATKSYFLFLIAAGVLYLAMTLISNRLFRYAERQVNKGAKHA